MEGFQIQVAEVSPYGNPGGKKKKSQEILVGTLEGKLEGIPRGIPEGILEEFDYKSFDESREGFLARYFGGTLKKNNEQNLEGIS